jgi:hypothetical protein
LPSANIRCVGGGSPRRKVVAPAPCGWRGERFPIVSAAIPIEDEEAAIERAMLRKPCPHCGGRVGVIDERED